MTMLTSLSEEGEDGDEGQREEEDEEGFSAPREATEVEEKVKDTLMSRMSPAKFRIPLSSRRGDALTVDCFLTAPPSNLQNRLQSLLAEHHRVVCAERM